MRFSPSTPRKSHFEKEDRTLCRLNERDMIKAKRVESNYVFTSSQRERRDDEKEAKDARSLCSIIKSKSKCSLGASMYAL